MRIIYLSSILLLATGCIQNYSNEYKQEAQNICRCMEDRKSLRRQNIPEDAQFINDDEDYKICIIDAKINMIDTKGKEFTAAINGECNEISKTHERYLKAL